MLCSHNSVHCDCCCGHCRRATSWQPEAEIVIEDNQELGSAYGKVAAGCADEETPGEEAGYRTLDRFARLLALFGGHVATRGEAGAAGLAVAGGGGTLVEAGVQRWVIE